MSILRRVGPKEYVGPSGEIISDTYSASGPALGRYPTKTSGRWLVKRSTGKLQRFDRLRDVRAALAAGAVIDTVRNEQ